MNQSVIGERVTDRVQSCQPARIGGADEPHKRHQQQRGIEGVSTLGLDEVSFLLVPEVCPDVFVDIVSNVDPSAEGCRERSLARQANGAVDCDPAHEARMQEMLRAAPHFPNAGIRLFPVFADIVDDVAHTVPAIMGNGMAVFVAEIDGIHQLAIDIELHLFCRTISDPHGTRSAIST